MLIKMDRTSVRFMYPIAGGLMKAPGPAIGVLYRLQSRPDGVISTK